MPNATKIILNSKNKIQNLLKNTVFLYIFEKYDQLLMEEPIKKLVSQVGISQEQAQKS